jgi:hypothetical protein
MLSGKWRCTKCGAPREKKATLCRKCYLESWKTPSADNFWPKVRIAGPNDCWLWMAERKKSGYGKIRIAGRQTMAHRVAWTLTHGLIPKGMKICHRCDNPPCCNPSHLWLGTQTENIADMDRKGRRDTSGLILFKRGEECPTAKLTWSDVREIRRSVLSGLRTRAEASRRLGVSPTTVTDIMKGRIWKEAV